MCMFALNTIDWVYHGHFAIDILTRKLVGSKPMDIEGFHDRDKDLHSFPDFWCLRLRLCSRGALCIAL